MASASPTVYQRRRLASHDELAQIPWLQLLSVQVYLEHLSMNTLVADPNLLQILSLTNLAALPKLLTPQLQIAQMPNASLLAG